MTPSSTGDSEILNVHSTESFGSVDGPGIRFVIFLKGCPMRCQFCHNPDSWSEEGAERMTVDEVLDRAWRFHSYWGKEGGITVSGGEALLQIDALTTLFRKAHERGINTCLDTSAQPFTRNGRSIVLTWPEADQFLSGANTVTLPSLRISCARARSPGACTPSSLVTRICMSLISDFGFWI